VIDMKKITFLLIALVLVSAFAFGISLNAQTVMSTATVEAINAQMPKLVFHGRRGLTALTGKR
jgi:hypothetical protein